MVVGPLGALVLRAGCCLCVPLRSVPVSSGPVGLGLVSKVGAHRLNVRLVPAGGVCGAWGSCCETCRLRCHPQKLSTSYTVVQIVAHRCEFEP